MRSRPFCLLVATLFAAGCLGPPDEVLPEDRLLDPVQPGIMEVSTIEEDPPDNLDVALLEATTVAYLQGYANGREVRYWNIGGPVNDLIAPAYYIMEGENQLGAPIIDVIPGDTGYTVWWRRVEVQVRPEYAGQPITSRAALDAGIEAGLLSPPVATSKVLNCPLVTQAVADDVPPSISGAQPSGLRVWYRGQAAVWVKFGDATEVPTTVRSMPGPDVYILQRALDDAPMYEFVTRVDANGDGVFDRSNNIFEFGIDEPAEYSPLWRAKLVLVDRAYPFFDDANNPNPVDLVTDAQALLPTTATATTPAVAAPMDLGQWVNCPIDPAEVGP